MKQTLLCRKLWLVLLLWLPLCVAAQVVKGTVSDAETGETLPGANVRTLDGSAAAVTDMDGRYTIKAAARDQLVFSYVGYQSKTVSVPANLRLDVVLESNDKVLENVVVIGYGTQKKADLTGAVAVVDMDEARKTAATNIYEMLQGQVPGISVSTTSEPGAMSRVQIRGVGSFNTVGPLYVLDGMIVNDVNHLNPNEIETMQVLKDASAAAIYGARGANGVILITTKKGRSGKPSLEVTGTWSIADMPRKLDMMSSTDFMYYNEQAYLNANTDWPAATWAKDHEGQYIPNTDWQKATYQRGFTQDYNLMYRQGSDNVNMAVGAGYMNQTGVFESPEYSRFTARVNTDATYGILKLGENLTFQHTKTDETIGGSFMGAITMPSVIPVYDPDEPAKHKNDPGFGYGSQQFPTYTTNPVAIQRSDRNQGVNDRVIGNFFAELSLPFNLTYKFNVGVDAWWGRHKYINLAYTKRMGSGEQRYDDVVTDNRDQRATIIMDNTLTFQRNFGEHNVTALVGHTTEEVNWHWLEAQGYNQQVPGLYEISLVGEQNNMAGKPERRRQTSYIARVDYNYAGRYLAQFNFRSDGSSKFGPENRRGYFPSFSLGWRISEEPFFEPLRSVVDNLKIRGSWGKVGDMQSLGNYSYIPTIDHSGPYEGYFAVFGPSGNENIHYGATQASKVNVNLGWETKTTTNLGLDFSLLNNRLYGTFEWFNAKSTDLLLNVPQSWATGISTLWTNYGEMRNRGIELQVGWRDKAGDLTYNVSANLSTVRNEVLRMGDAYVQNGYTRTEVGRSISDFYLLKADGIFQSMDEIMEYTTMVNGQPRVIQPNAQPGDVKYIDVNQDGQIDDNDRDWCGSPMPKFELGLNVSLAYKGFDFNMFWAGKFGGKILNEVRKNTLNFNVDNIPDDVSPWTWDNPSNEYPRMYANSTDNNKASDRFLENGTFFRLKNLQLGYTLPQQLTKKAYIEKVRAYVSATNLITLTKYKGYDPDIICTDVYYQGIDWGQYPSTRQINFGVQVEF